MTEGSKWFGKGFVPGSFTPPPPMNQGPQDVYNRGRFYVKADEEKKVLFLDNLEDGFRYVEHYRIWDTVQQRPYFFPCLALMGKPCYLCEKGCPRHRVLALTVLDVDGYVAKKGENAGKHIKNIKRLFVVSERELGLFIRKSNAAGGLKFQEFNVYRSNNKASRLGDDITPLRRRTRAELDAEKVDWKPFDYEKVIPLTLTSDDQKKFFEENPSATWLQSDQQRAPASAPPGEGVTEAPEDVPF